MKRRWRLGANISLTPSSAAADCAVLAGLGGVVVRTSQEQGWGSVASRLGPYRKACDDHGLELFQTCQPAGHVVPKTQAGLDAWGDFVAECASIADRTSGGNEVNGYGSNETPNPAGQAEMFVAALEAVERAGLRVRMATPSLCPASGKLGASYVEPLLFFDAMVAAQPSMLRHGVEVDWHGYAAFDRPPGTPATWNTCWRTRALHKDLVVLGHAATRITWSEFGQPSGNYAGCTPGKQALVFDQYLVEAGLQTVQDGVRHAELIWYQLRDRTGAEWTDRCGLVDVHGANKPVATRFAAAATLGA